MLAKSYGFANQKSCYFEINEILEEKRMFLRKAGEYET